jgi:hypothetical protein
MPKKIISVIVLSMLALGLLVLAHNVQRISADLEGDINGDGEVNIEDVAMAAFAFGSTVGHPRWESKADINGDNVVDMVDIYIIGSHFGESVL